MNAHDVSRRFDYRRRSALTLLELVVVMVVLVALAGMTIPMFENVTNQSQSGATTATLRQLQDAIVNRFAVDMKGASDGSGTYFYDGLPRANATANAGVIQSQPQLVWLFKAPALANPASPYNTTTRLGWNGPYLMSGQATYPATTLTMFNGQTAEQNGFYTVSGTTTFGNYGDQAALDAWGNPIVIVYIQESNPSGIYYVSSNAYYILLAAGQNGTLDPSISSAAVGTPLAAAITPATNTTPRTLTIGSTQYLYWLPLQ